MRTSWPFTGRAAVLDEICSVLGAYPGRGVVLAGPAGVGKSRLAAEALRRLEPDAFTVVRVGATQAGASIPFGAFGNVLPTDRPAAGAADPIHWAAGALSDLAEPGRLLISVDDAHLLDPASATLLHHLARHGHGRVLATVRTGERAPGPVVALWRESLLRRLRLDPLSVDGMREVLEAVLGGRLEDSTALRLFRVTRGNLLFLREMVLGGLLTETGGVWRWRGELPMTTRLRELVDARIGTLDGPERDVLEYVAFGEPLDLGTLNSLTSQAAIERAAQRQLIEVVQRDRRREARLAHPMYGEVARDRVGLLRTSGLLTDLAKALEKTGLRRREDLLRSAVWRLDSGTASDPPRLLGAAWLAWSAHDLGLAIRLGRAALDAGGGIAAAGLLGTVLHFADRHEEAETVLLQVAGTAVTDTERAAYAWTRSLNLSWGLHRSADADRLVDEAIAAITDQVPLQEMQALRAVYHFYAGRFPAALEQPVEELTPAIEATMAFVRAGVDCYAGRNGPGIAAMSTVFAGRANWHDEIPNLVQSVLHARIQSAIFAGELAAAAEYTEVIHRPATESGTWERAVAVTGVIHGQVCRLRGEVREALRLGQAGLDWADQVQTGFSALVLGEYAHAAALLGKADAASAALARVECDILPATIVLAFPAVLARTWERAAQGDLPGAVRAALDAAAEADALELRGFRLFALHDVVRLGSARLVAADLRELEVDGELAPLCARHAEAAVAADGAALAEVSAGFQELGMILYAAEAAAQAARAYEAAGRVKEAHVLGGQAWVLARRCQGARTPALAWLAAPELTARQLEIAQLAAAGLSNKEIADRSAISVRTVANHLGAVYERLGVHDRAELSALLGPVTR